MFNRQHFIARAARVLLLGVIAVLTPWIARGQTPQGEQVHAFEKDIQTFEAKDRQAKPAEGGILFVGSSSIRLWDLGKSFPDVPVINRGFGGSLLTDSVFFAERIVLPYKPKIIVLYAGDNDIAAGHTPEQVASDFQAFVKKVHAALPATRIVFIALKPSIQRWAMVEKMRQANDLVRKAIHDDKQLAYVDTSDGLLGPDGKPRAELFQPDGLHLNADGYKIWTALLLPLIK